MSEIGLRIKELRKKSGLTQLELSNGIISRSYLSQIEKGNVLPTAETVRRLAQKLNCAEEELYKTPNTNMQKLNEIKKSIHLLESHLETDAIDFAIEKLKSVDIFVEGINESDKGTYFWAKAKIEEYLDNQIETRKFYLESLRHYNNTSLTEKKIRTLNDLGSHYINSEEFEEGFNVLNKAYREIIYSHINGVLKINNLYLLALNHTKIGEVFSAILFLEEAKRHSEQLSIFYKYGNISLLLAVCYKEISKWHDAVIENEKALNYFKLREDKDQIATIYYNIGILYYEIKNWDASEDFLERARKLFLELGHEKGMHMVDLALLKLYRSTRELTIIKDFADNIIENKPINFQISIYLILGEVFYTNKKLGESYKYYERALALFDDEEVTTEVISGCKQMIKVCFEMKKYSEAETYYQILDKLDHKKKKMDILL